MARKKSSKRAKKSNMPKSKPVDRIPILSGTHGTEFGGYSKEQQCGIARKKK